jgi:hypothetical protein
MHPVLDNAITEFVPQHWRADSVADRPGQYAGSRFCFCAWGFHLDRSIVSFEITVKDTSFHGDVPVIVKTGGGWLA